MDGSHSMTGSTTVPTYSYTSVFASTAGYLFVGYTSSAGSRTGSTIVGTGSTDGSTESTGSTTTTTPTGSSTAISITGNGYITG